MYYESWFELSESPFSISPDPRYLYLTQNHREALAHLLYGVSSNGGFVLLTGEIGAGKTTVCRCLLEQLPDNCDVAYVLNSKLSAVEFLASICDELAIPRSEQMGLKHGIDRIHRYLLNAHSHGRNTVLMVDEAQNLDIEVIEHLRLLTNLETSEKKLLQIILVGQPELRDKLALPEMKPMAQRITARFHLGALNHNEIRAYIRHRLQVAGVTRDLFTRECYKKLWQYSRGVPRLINTISDRALLGAFVSKLKRVDGTILDYAAAEVLGKLPAASNSRRWALTGLVAVLMAGAFAAAYHYQIAGEWYAGTSRVNKEKPVAQAFESLPRLSDDPVQQQQDEPQMSNEIVQVNDSDIAQAEPQQTIPAVEPQAQPVRPALQLPANMDTTVLQKQATAVLLARWNIDNSGGSILTLCDIAENHGLACLRQQGTLESLRKVNRPALLTLYAEDGADFPAALIAIDANSAVLVVGGQRQQIDLSELRRWWYGQFLVLWQPPPGYRVPLRPGAQGDAVSWVLQKLQAPGDSPVYDGAVASLVKWFQLENGLIPDGVVGPQTLIALNNSNESSVPRLYNGEHQE